MLSNFELLHFTDIFGLKFLVNTRLGLSIPVTAALKYFDTLLTHINLVSDVRLSVVPFTHTSDHSIKVAASTSG